MGGFLAGPKKPKPPPSPTQIIPPPIPTPLDPRVLEARDTQKKRRQDIRRNTVKTNAEGILGNPLGQKTLLGL